MNTKTILIVIALLLAGILGVMVYQMNEPKTPLEQFEADLNEAGEDLGEAVEELGEDIQDAVNPKP